MSQNKLLNKTNPTWRIRITACACTDTWASYIFPWAAAALHRQCWMTAQIGEFHAMFLKILSLIAQDESHLKSVKDSKLCSRNGCEKGNQPSIWQQNLDFVAWCIYAIPHPIPNAEASWIITLTHPASWNPHPKTRFPTLSHRPSPTDRTYLNKAVEL